MILPRTFYQRDTAEVARDLLGKILVYKTSQGRITGKIVETEAYYGHYDPASHAYRKTPRSSIMFGPPGFAYVYFNYGVHYLLNVVTAKINTPGAVLIRAVEPLEGIELMKKNRGNLPPEKLCNGPGKLTKAFGIDISFNGHDLTKYPLVIQNGKKGAPIIKNTTRVGISVAKDELLRYYIEGNRFISRR